MRRSTDGDELTPRELAAWQGMLATTTTLRSELDAQLRARHEMTIADYDVLVRLAGADGRRMRMSELAASAFQPPSSLTRIVGGLTRRGWVARERDPDDGRGWQAVLTPAGVTAFRAAQRDHLAHVRRRFLAPLTDADLEALAGAWSAIEVHG